METGGIWHAAADNTAVETHLYSVTLDDGTRATEIEEFLAKVEGKAAGPFEKVLRGENVEGQERADLASFFAMMFVRTNSFRRTYAEAFAGYMNIKLYATAQHDGAFRTAMEEYEAEHGPLSDKEKEDLRDGMLHPKKFKLAVDREFTLSALTVHDGLAPILFDMDWSTLIPPEGRYFISSDNPFTREVPSQHLHPLEGPGFLHKHVEVLFPLSSNRCLLAHWNKDRQQLLNIPPELVKLANRTRAVNAERFLFGPVRDSGIAALGRKYRDVKAGMKIGGFGPEEFSAVEVKKLKP